MIDNQHFMASICVLINFLPLHFIGYLENTREIMEVSKKLQKGYELLVNILNGDLDSILMEITIAFFVE